MKLLFNLLVLCFAVTFNSCNKNANDINDNPLLEGKWKVTETLADPGDGSGVWQPVNKPDFYFIRFRNNESVETNYYSDIVLPVSYKKLNDSALVFINSNGDSLYRRFKIEAGTLTITGGCYEACGTKFIRDLF